MKKFLILFLLLISISMWALGPKKVNFCGKMYKSKKIIKGITLKNCNKHFFTHDVTDIYFKRVNLDSLITKNKFTLIVFSSIYAIGCGNNIGVREALLKSLVKEFPGKIIETIEYWDNDEMNRTVSELQDNKIKFSYTFEIVKDLPIYLDRSAKNIQELIVETGPYFLHSGWAIIDRNHHIKYLFLEDVCSEPNSRKMKKTAKIIRKYLSM